MLPVLTLSIRYTAIVVPRTMAILDWIESLLLELPVLTLSIWDQTLAYATLSKPFGCFTHWYRFCRVALTNLSLRKWPFREKHLRQIHRRIILKTFKMTTLQMGPF